MIWVSTENNKKVGFIYFLQDKNIIKPMNKMLFIIVSKI